METGHHPPLYYYLGTLVSLPLNLTDYNQAQPNPHFSFSNTDGGVNRFEHDNDKQATPNSLLAVHLLRLISTLFGAGTLALIYASGLLLFGGSGWEYSRGGRIPALLATGMVATLPQFNFLSGAANNDNAVIFFCTFSLYLCLRLTLAPPLSRGSALLFYGLVGLVAGLGLLSKYNEIVYIPLLGLALALNGWSRRSWAIFWKSSLISGGVCVAVAGWWFVRAQILYGDPAGWGMWRSSYHSIEQEDKFHLTRAFLEHTWSRWFNSFWGYFGWFNLPLESAVYTGLAWLSVVVAVGIAGLCLNFLLQTVLKTRSLHSRWLSKPGQYDRRTGYGLLFCGLAIGLVLISAFNYAATFGDAGTQGRYLFPALAPLALLGGGGLVWLFGLLRLLKIRPGLLRQVGTGLVCCWLAGFGWLNFHALNDVIRPAYQPLQDIRRQFVVDALPAGTLKPANPLCFQSTMQLEGYNFEPGHQAALKPGKIKVTLYWRAKNPRPLKDNWISISQLVDSTQVFDRNDGPPVGGRYQTYKWQPGELIKDERVFNLQDGQLKHLQQSKETLKIYLAWARSPDWLRATLPDGSNGVTLNWQP